MPPVEYEMSRVPALRATTRQPEGRDPIGTGLVCDGNRRLAAQALVHGAALVTRDSVFNEVTGLDILW